eukprot:CAMPEP_0170600070 /NCGR_PEP_ID=MMETSP0224-20130122/17141_1 /TAXON_ID=285029 /ORGANISM="Togula jolla, Strain CCCM 725" /LENGTH=452 /DNA_ID=CAMNT_0010924777 /DNA_START=48 /DNA_END=1406 /DNA_ORIENTATION=+
MIKGADLQLLPASFRAMEVDLHTAPFTLALLALCQGVSAAATGPIWGNLVDSGVSRKMLLVIGSGCWGLCTFLLAFVSTLTSMALLRVFNGAALSMLLPVVQSFVAELAGKEDRGSVFGWLYFSSNLGQLLACLFVTPISSQKVFGMDGWRFALAVTGALSWSVMLIIPSMIHEEPPTFRPHRLGIQREIRKLNSFIRIPTFCVIILQGVFGTVPGAAFSFITMFFQYMGISDFEVALVIALRVIGEACGGLLGGTVGDGLHNWSHKYGRALTAQISILSSIPMVLLIFLCIPRNVTMITAFGGLLFLHGVMGAWVAPGCICPIMCEIVPRSSLASAYAWELALVFCSGNLFGPMMVGLLSQQIFGYTLSDEPVSQMKPEIRQQNAEALGKALFLSSAIPYVLCAALFTLLYFTYEKDCRNAQSSDNEEGALPKALESATTYSGTTAGKAND